MNSVTRTLFLWVCDGGEGVEGKVEGGGGSGENAGYVIEDEENTGYVLGEWRG